MGILDLDQLRALAELKRRTTALAEARANYLTAEAQCWRQGISHRQIAAVAGAPPKKVPVSPSSIHRRSLEQMVR